MGEKINVFDILNITSICTIVYHKQNNCCKKTSVEDRMF